MSEQMHNNLQVIFPETETQTTVSVSTLHMLGTRLGMDEATLIHYALRLLANQLLKPASPAYEADDGPLTAEQMEQIRLAAGPQEFGVRISSLIR